MITTYFLLAIISILIIIVAVLLGKKLREMKDAKDLQNQNETKSAEEKK